MKGQTLRAAALLTFALSMGLGVVAFRMAASPPPAAPDRVHQERILVAREPLETDEPIAANEVMLSAVELRPTGSFAVAEQVVGRSPSRRVEAGEPILASQFREGGTLALGLREDERAVAVRVDGVVGLGGFARPGDIVDVLFFAKRDGREVEATQARILLEHVRVLTFGTDADAGHTDQPALDARTAVLAVPREQAPVLLLADSAGKLRLALRDVQAPQDAQRPRQSALVQLEDLIGGERTPRAASEHSVVVYRGLEQ